MAFRRFEQAGLRRLRFRTLPPCGLTASLSKWEGGIVKVTAIVALAVLGFFGVKLASWQVGQADHRRRGVRD
jgi:hypothetical protein